MAAGTPGGPRAGEAARAHAFAALRQAILSGDLAPGQRLVEEDLAGTLGVTRQSLRAALLDLTAEGSSSASPTGARVSGSSPPRRPSRSPSAGWPWRRSARSRRRSGSPTTRPPSCASSAENLKRSVADGQPAQVLRAQPGAAPPGRRHLRPACRGRPARAAARPARPAPVPARAAARPAGGVARRAPGHPRRGRRPPPRGRQPRRPRPPGQRHRGAAGRTSQADGSRHRQSMTFPVYVPGPSHRPSR